MPRKSRKANENPITGKLTEVFANGDDKAFREILKNLALAYGMNSLSKDSGYNRVSLWRYLMRQQDIKLSGFIAVLKALGIVVHFRIDPQIEKKMRFFEWQRNCPLSEQIALFGQETSEPEADVAENNQAIKER